MNRQELIDAVAARAGNSKAATGEAINAVFKVIACAVTAGDAVQLVGFGAFSLGQHAARIGGNPSAGVEIRVAAAETVKFTVGKAFRDSMSAS